MHQRLQSSYLNNRAAQTYTPLQDFESKQLLVDLLSTNDFSARYSRYASSMIMSLAYGKRFVRGDESQLKRIQKVVENFIGAARVGVWIVDALPVLNYLPKLIAPWKRYADDLYAYESNVHGDNFTSAKESSSRNWSKHVSGKAADLGSDDYLRNIPSLELAYNLGIIFMAGSDTQTITLEFFTVAAVLNPQIMRKAQAELDAVVGADRLPTFLDSPKLPYVHAIIQEVLRWRPFLASGMPHAVTQDDEYMGYRIPKDSLVIANHWALGHDEAIFPNPEQFRPERWIEDPSLPVFAWGFGRRSCPGRHVAINSLFIIIARMLWAFDIEHTYEVKHNDELKRVRCEVDPMALEQGMSSRPVPFRAVFKVRSPKAEEVIRKEWEESEKDIDVVLEGIGNAQRETKVS
jgi:hypothetical protein